MKPGRELDALIAEKVMGKRTELYGGHLVEAVDTSVNRGVYPLEYLVPHYSTSIADAWQVSEVFAARGWHVDVYRRDHGWSCALAEKPFKSALKDIDVSELGESPAHAICLAALKACGVRV